MKHHVVQHSNSALVVKAVSFILNMKSVSSHEYQGTLGMVFKRGRKRTRSLNVFDNLIYTIDSEIF